MKILKIGDYAKIKETTGVQFDNKAFKYKEGKLVGKIVKIFKGNIYKVEIAPANYLFCGERNLIKIENENFQKKNTYKENLKFRKGIENNGSYRHKFAKR